MQDFESFLYFNEKYLQQLNEFPFLFFTPPPLKMHFEDVIKGPEKILNLQNSPPFVHFLTIEEIEIFYSQSAANLLENESSIAPIVITHVSYPIHFAARDGNTEDIEQYTLQGFDVNQRDLHSITPLHVAALFGQLASVKKLLELGAKVDVTGYENHTPLHFALMKQHFDIAHLLLQEHADPLVVDFEGNNGFSIIFDTLANQLVGLDSPSNAKLSKINQLFNMIDAMIRHSDGPILYSSLSEIHDELYLTPHPGAFVLQSISTFACKQDLVDKVLALVEHIKATDPSWEIFLNAKNLLHRFPTGEFYQIKMDPDNEIWFSSEGHLGVLTTELAANSLKHFIDQMGKEDSLKLALFQSLKNIYDDANEYAQYAYVPQTSAKALALYNEGHSILLPSGWDGHFVDVILSKSQSIYVVANSGDRYHGESPDFEPDPPGILFYKLHEPEKISEKFIYNILTNVDRMSLEYENAYEYGVIEKIDDIIRENQTYGNCGWESHRNAVEGLIYIELLNRNMPPKEAKELAHTYYEEWDQFHGNFVIDNYLSGEPGLPFQAMLDMLQQIHLKTPFTQTDHMHSQKLADALLTSHYIQDFQDWVSNFSHDLSEGLMLNILQEQHGIDIHHLSKHFPEIQESQDVVPMMLHCPLIETPIPVSLEI